MRDVRPFMLPIIAVLCSTSTIFFAQGQISLRWELIFGTISTLMWSKPLTTCKMLWNSTTVFPPKHVTENF